MAKSRFFWCVMMRSTKHFDRHQSTRAIGQQAIQGPKDQPTTTSHSQSDPPHPLPTSSSFLSWPRPTSSNQISIDTCESVAQRYDENKTTTRTGIQRQKERTWYIRPWRFGNRTNFWIVEAVVSLLVHSPPSHYSTILLWIEYKKAKPLPCKEVSRHPICYFFHIWVSELASKSEQGYDTHTLSNRDFHLIGSKLLPNPFDSHRQTQSHFTRR